MADAKLFIGGTPNSNYPNCNGAYEFAEPHARRIAFEYANGYFTLGWPLQPSEKNYQFQELMNAETGLNDHIMMYVVPEQHLLTGVLFEVLEGDARMAGAALRPSGMLYDHTTKQYTPDTVLDKLFTNTAITAPFEKYGHLAEPYYVPKGKTLVLTLRVNAVPTDKDVKLHTTTAKAQLVAKVQGFDVPTEV
ncbi:hypothetical protein GLO29_21940 [Escherichia coli]|uniref:hypothetical protein n=1 Tax=Escherichia coli TaxID=562 RepID=UPI002AC72A04|nr:hypothetical protein [Escherichia coli]MDZ4903363.1 hypothetical protein [Escherichia coli]